jgi:naphthoate synthase
VAEWQRSGPEPGKDDSDVRHGSAGRIAKVTINRPEVRHASRPTTLFELPPPLDFARDDAGLGVTILTGPPKTASCRP